MAAKAMIEILEAAIVCMKEFWKHLLAAPWNPTGNHAHTLKSLEPSGGET
jgi:hypothetical protein